MYIYTYRVFDKNYTTLVAVENSKLNRSPSKLAIFNNR